MMRAISTVIFCLCVGSMFGQVAGDYRSNVSSGLWSNVTTWQIFNGGAWIAASATPTSAAGTITIQAGNNITVQANVPSFVSPLTIDQLVINGTLTVSNNFVVRVVDSPGVLPDILINSTGILQINGGQVIRSSGAPTFQIFGVVNNGGTLTNSPRITFEAGSAYNHDFSSGSTGGNIPQGSIWRDGSVCRVRGDIFEPPGFINQSFSRFEWNTPVLSNSPLDFDGILPTARGNMDFVTTGGAQLQLASGTDYILSVGGNLSFSAAANVALAIDNNATVNIGGNLNNASTDLLMSGGTGNVNVNVTNDVTLTGGTIWVTDAAGSGHTTLTLGRNYLNLGTTFQNLGAAASADLIFNGAGNQTFTSNVPAPTFPINFTTANTSNLILPSGSALGGPGNLNIVTGTSLTLQSVNAGGALRNGAVGGNVRVTGTRTYNGPIIYAGAAQQYMSSDHPGGANTIINNAANVSMLGSVDFTPSTLTLTSGILQIDNAATLTVANVVQTTGSIGIRSTSNLIVAGSGAFGNLALTHLDGGFSMNNLTINRGGGGNVTQATTTLVVGGTLALSQGTLDLGANTATTVSGNWTVGTGSMTGTISTNLAINNVGSLPAGVSITGALNRLTMSRGSSTLTLTNTNPSFLDVTNLELFNGTVTGASGLRMANAGLINRSNGFLGAAIGAVGIYNLDYTDYAANITSGPEIPASPSAALNRLTLNNNTNSTNTVTLTSPVDAAGNLNLTRGVLVTNNFNINTGGSLTIAATSGLTPGTSTVTFDGTVPQFYTSAPLVTLNNLDVNQTGGFAFTVASPLQIANRFGINSASTATVGTDLLTLMSTATATAFVPALPSGASIVGTAIVQRRLPNANGTRQYRYISSATTNSTVADWQAEFPVSGNFANPSSGTFGGVTIVSSSPSLFYYNEPQVGGGAQSAGYVAYPGPGVNSAAASLENGLGYAAFVRTTAVLTFDEHGTLGQGVVPKTVTRGSGPNSGWNLLGNPYPSPINWNLVTRSNVDNAIYLTDNTQNSGTINVSYVNGVSTPGSFTGVVAQGQAFFVRVTSAGSGTVTFNESSKAPVQQQFYREAAIQNLLRVTMKTGAVTDEIAIRMHDDATTSFDSQFDAYKFGATGVNISSLTKENEQLSINSIGRNACGTTVPLFIEAGVNGSYTLDFSGIDTFDGGLGVVLYDKVTNTRSSLASISQYAFTSSDAATLTNRFELVFDGPTLLTALPVTGETICESNTLANVSLESSQLDVKYTAMLGGTVISDEISGNGGALQIPVSVNLLPQGVSEITITAKASTCDARVLSNKATLEIVKKGSISSVRDGSTCGSGVVSLTANGLDATLYNWYEDVNDETPIADQHTANFVTPTISKSKTYYVAAQNSLGCEGTRVAIQAIVSDLDPVTITGEGNLLTSSYATGNQWYIDGSPVDGQDGQTIEANISGTYSVEATSGTCKVVSEGREMTVLGFEELSSKFVTVYPNPTTEKITVDVRSNETSIEVNLINAAGVQLNTLKLSGTQDVKSGEFNLISFPDGIYMIRVNDGGKLYTKKVLKVK